MIKIVVLKSQYDSLVQELLDAQKKIQQLKAQLWAEHHRNLTITDKYRRSRRRQKIEHH
jgi:Tfp pilus assembly major pilin PilA